MLNKSTIFGSTTLKFSNGMDLFPVFGNGSLSIMGLRSGKTGRFLEAVTIKNNNLKKKILLIFQDHKHSVKR